MLARIQARLPYTDLTIMVHGMDECLPQECSKVEVGVQAKYVAGACKLEKNLKRRSVGGEG